MDAPPPAWPQDLDAFTARYEVMAQYGAAMLHVQTFERALASLVSAIEHGHRIGSKRSVERRLKQSEQRVLHLFHNATAKELCNELRGKVDDDLISELEPLVAWRNFLAHSDLTSRLALITEPKDIKRQAPVLMDELCELGEAFTAATQRVAVAVEAYVDSLRLPDERPQPPDDEAEAFRAALHRLTRSLLEVQPERFSRGANLG